jgi:hypothetical protein
MQSSGIRFPDSPCLAPTPLSWTMFLFYSFTQLPWANHLQSLSPTGRDQIRRHYRMLSACGRVTSCWIINWKYRKVHLICQMSYFSSTVLYSAGCFALWSRSWLGVAAHCCSQYFKRVSGHMFLAWEKIKIQSIVSTECASLLHHHKVRKL